MKRLACLDYAKALTIVAVLLFHVGFSQISRGLLFAMPLYFAVTGCSFTPGKRTWKQSVAIRFRTVLVPFWILMLFYGLIEMIRAPLFGYGSWEILFPSLASTVYGSGILPFTSETAGYLKQIVSYKAQTQIGVDVILPSNCHLWFLPAMFTAYALFTALAERTRANLWRKLGSVALLLLLAAVEVVFPGVRQLPYGIGRGALGAAFMLVGFWLKEAGALECRSARFHGLSCGAALVVFAAAMALGSDGSALVRSVYGPYGGWSVPVTFLGGTAGVWLMLELCRGLEQLPLGKIKALLSFAGRNVMTVYAMHMAVKFVLDAVYVLILHAGEPNLLDEYQMGLMPETAWGYMLFETAAMLVVCLLGAYVREKCRNRKL